MYEVENVIAKGEIAYYVLHSHLLLMCLQVEKLTVIVISKSLRQLASQFKTVMNKSFYFILSLLEEWVKTNSMDNKCLMHWTDKVVCLNPEYWLIDYLVFYSALNVFSAISRHLLGKLPELLPLFSLWYDPAGYWTRNLPHLRLTFYHYTKVVNVE